jgi:hypothetical protein
MIKMGLCLVFGVAGCLLGGAAVHQYIIEPNLLPLIKNAHDTAQAASMFVSAFGTLGIMGAVSYFTPRAAITGIERIARRVQSPR